MRRLKEEGIRLLDKFNRPQNYDKLIQAETHIGDLKQGAQEAMNRMMANQDELSDLEYQTNQLKDTAGKFEKNAKSLECKMCCNKWMCIIT